MASTLRNKPGAIWNTLTRIKCVLNESFEDSSTQKHAKSFLKRCALTAAAPIAYQVAGAIPLLMSLPLVTPIAAAVCLVATLGFGVAAYRAGRRACTTSAVENALRDELRSWEQAQKGGTFMQRLLDKSKMVLGLGAAVLGTAVAGSFYVQKNHPGILPEVPQDINAALVEGIKNQTTLEANENHMMIGGGTVAVTGLATAASGFFAARRRKQGVSSPKAAAPKP